MVLLNNKISQLDQLKHKLNEIKNKADKAKVQEEYLLNQLKESFECNHLEEGLELLEVLTEETKSIDKDIDTRTNEILNKMNEEGFI